MCECAKEMLSCIILFCILGVLLSCWVLGVDIFYIVFVFHNQKY